MIKALVMLALATAGGLLALYGEEEIPQLLGIMLFVPTAFRGLALSGEKAAETATPFALLALSTALILEGGPPGLAVFGVVLGGYGLLPLVRGRAERKREEGTTW